MVIWRDRERLVTGGEAEVQCSGAEGRGKCAVDYRNRRPQYKAMTVKSLGCQLGSRWTKLS